MARERRRRRPPVAWSATSVLGLGRWTGQWLVEIGARAGPQGLFERIGGLVTDGWRVLHKHLTERRRIGVPQELVGGER